ncbi:hypothetical protein ACFOET_19700 [Parapedobacter deserti]|uniref:Uncharacterized protein n=1 Tax=Parapedobacter deserti TaxID=1912957 RepID=A0ABV7JUD1_9SPHI
MHHSPWLDSLLDDPDQAIAAEVHSSNSIDAEYRKRYNKEALPDQL